MTQYALNDRGSLDLVTEDFYDTEILRLMDSMRFDREQVLDAQAVLVPEPDNPHFPRSIAVRVNGLKIGRFSPEDSRRYYDALARVVASGYEPVVPIRVWATMHRWNGQVGLESRAVLSISRPELLFPLNASPLHAAVLPQGPTLKVLDEKDHAEYLHGILPVSGEGRVILTLEVNRVRQADGSEIDSVDVLHDRKVVGRLSTQMSEQLAPVVRYAFEHYKLTAAWGTIRGNAFELSLTVQTVRAADLPVSWYADLPNDLPQLKPAEQVKELEPAYQPSHAEKHPESRRTPRPAAAGQEPPQRADAAEEPGRIARRRPREAGSGGLGTSRPGQRLGWSIGILGILILMTSLVVIFFHTALGVLGVLLGVSLGFCGLYLGRLDQPQEDDSRHPALDQDAVEADPEENGPVGRFDDGEDREDRTGHDPEWAQDEPADARTVVRRTEDAEHEVAEEAEGDPQEEALGGPEADAWDESEEELREQELEETERA